MFGVERAKKEAKDTGEGKKEDKKIYRARKHAFTAIGTVDWHSEK